MTTGGFDTQHWVAAAPESVQRILGLARRSLRALRSSLVDPHGFDPDSDAEHFAVLSAVVVPCDEPVARLVVHDARERLWSEDDRAILEDLAAQLAEEIRLRRERERQRAVFDLLPGLVFERRKTGSTEARYTFLGAAKTVLPAVRELVEGGTSGASLHFIHRDDRDAVRDAMARSTREESDLDLLFRVKDFDSRLRWLRSQSVAHREADGSVVWTGFCFDVTDLVARLVAEPVGTSSDMLDASLDEVPATPPEPYAVEAEQPDALRILLADDLDLNRKLISDMLSLDGYVVDSVPDGAAAVEAAKTKPYDLILMDMIMPGMDGMDATRAIRALPAPACDVPIVALTAHSFREQLDHCLDAGMNATLTKPMSFDALSDAVNTWARSRRQAA